MYDFIEDNSILIIPNSLKDNMLKYIRKYKRNFNIKIFSLDEFIKKTNPCFYHMQTTAKMINLLSEKGFNF